MNVRILVSLMRRTRRHLRREVVMVLERTRCFRQQTFIDPRKSTPGKVAHRFAFLDRRFSEALNADFLGYAKLIREQAEQSLRHCFDLLGSGPSIVAHGMKCRGIDGVTYAMSETCAVDQQGRWLEGRINRANLVAAKRIWQEVRKDYAPIDWQIDFKSGYRWREDTWHRGIRIGDLRGVDIKLPWELARLQHLSALALACHFSAAGAEGFKTTDVYAQEVRNQILDFIATNPPGFGVNWACAMDVAIRAANLLVARDIVLASGERLDDAFEAIFFASMLAHARHILANLEWAPHVRGNHYLANIAGLLFIAVYLPSSTEVDTWLSFAVQELLGEVAYQFHEDGSNFEASVCYHRLSSEMVLWAYALLSDLPFDKRAALSKSTRIKLVGRPLLHLEPLTMHRIAGTDRQSPIPDWAWVRLSKMAQFTRAMTRDDGLVVQFGDNDSGRFITLGSGEQLRAANDPASLSWSLDHRSLLAGIRSLNCGPESPVDEDPAARILRGLTGFDQAFTEIETVHRHIAVAFCTIGGDSAWDEHNARFKATAMRSRWTSAFVADSPGLPGGLQCLAFPGMGCYVMRGTRFYLALRCGEIGLAGLGAHAHCDQLAIELVIDGHHLVRDPGSFIYTPFPAKRNAYRSAIAHHVPRVLEREPADLTRGIFDMRGAAEGECLYFGLRGFVGRHSGYGSWVYRIVELKDDRIEVRDFAEGLLPLADPAPADLPFSPGYGRIAE